MLADDLSPVRTNPEVERALVMVRQGSVLVTSLLEVLEEQLRLVGKACARRDHLQNLLALHIRVCG